MRLTDKTMSLTAKLKDGIGVSGLTPKVLNGKAAAKLKDVDARG